jgi:hypothetical protein
MEGLGQLAATLLGHFDPLRPISRPSEQTEDVSIGEQNFTFLQTVLRHGIRAVDLQPTNSAPAPSPGSEPDQNCEHCAISGSTDYKDCRIHNCSKCNKPAGHHICLINHEAEVPTDSGKFFCLSCLTPDPDHKDDTSKTPSPSDPALLTDSSLAPLLKCDLCCKPLMQGIKPGLGYVPRPRFTMTNGQQQLARCQDCAHSSLNTDRPMRTCSGPCARSLSLRNDFPRQNSHHALELNRSPMCKECHAEALTSLKALRALRAHKTNINLGSTIASSTTNETSLLECFQCKRPLQENSFSKSSLKKHLFRRCKECMRVVFSPKPTDPNPRVSDPLTPSLSAADGIAIPSPDLSSLPTPALTPDPSPSDLSQTTIPTQSPSAPSSAMLNEKGAGPMQPDTSSLESLLPPTAPPLPPTGLSSRPATAPTSPTKKKKKKKSKKSEKDKSKSTSSTSTFPSHPMLKSLRARQNSLAASANSASSSDFGNSL